MKEKDSELDKMLFLEEWRKHIERGKQKYFEELMEKRKYPRYAKFRKRTR